MPIFQTILIAIGLSMDAFAAAICVAAWSGSLRLKTTLLMASLFGGFQMLMPLIGWRASMLASAYIEKAGHWIAAGLLFYIGGKMLIESLKNSPAEIENKNRADPANIWALLALSVATSIDALAVCVSYGCINCPIIKPAIIIGLATFLITLIGALLGKRISRTLGEKSGVLGGAILILIAAKILFEHMA